MKNVSCVQKIIASSNSFPLRLQELNCADVYGRCVVGGHEAGRSMSGIDRLNVPAIDNSSH